MSCAPCRLSVLSVPDLYLHLKEAPSSCASSEDCGAHARWGNERFKTRERKARNTTTYPLSAVVGAAIIHCFKNGRPTTRCARCSCAPWPTRPDGFRSGGLSGRHFIGKVDVTMPRAGFPCGATQLSAASGDRPFLPKAHWRPCRSPQRDLDADLRYGARPHRSKCPP